MIAKSARAWLAALLLLPAAGRADVRVPSFFADHMVLQRDAPVPVWGTAEPGEQVTVAFAGQSVSAAAAADGKWLVRLAPMKAGSAGQELSIRGKNALVIRDVLVGDVWLCSGQSNMSISAGGFSQFPEVKQDLAEAKFPLIRQFGAVENHPAAPQADVKGSWVVCSPPLAGRISAVAFYFARKVHAETGVPIGILRAAKGSTGIEAWMSQETLLNTPALEPFAAKMRQSLAQWEQEKQAALAAGVQPTATNFPAYPFGPAVRRPSCTTLYNGMIAPLAPYALRGVLWYQGEHNAGDVAAARQYIEKMRALIGSWRRLFGNEDLPFYFVQLPAYLAPSDKPAGGEPWAYLREAQRACLAIPHTGMAITIDIGEAGNIHPKNKLDVGERLARLALKNEYGKTDLVASGPLFRDMQAEGGKLRIRFDAAGGGLMAGKKEGRAPAAEDPGAKLRRFAIAGADRQWVWADAVIEPAAGPGGAADTVVVSSPQVPAPVAVRYAFSSNPEGTNLYNRQGFRLRRSGRMTGNACA